MTACKGHLGQDYQRLSESSNYDSLVESLHKKRQESSGQTMPTLLERIEQSLGYVKAFTLTISVTIPGPVVRTALIWGALNLLVEVSIMSLMKFQRWAQTGAIDL